MYRRLKSPLIVQIELTEKCWNNCFHCYNFWREREFNHPVRGEDFPTERIESSLVELAKAGVFHVVATGGEPLMNRAALFKLIKKANVLGVTVTVNSSLISLVERDVLLFKEFGVKNVLTSVLGSTPERHDAITQNPGSFAKTMRSVKLLQRLSVAVSANMVVSKMNLGDIKETANLVKKLGIRNFNATRAGSPGNCQDFSGLRLTQDEFHQYLDSFYSLREIKELHCDALEGYPLCGLGDIQKHSMFLGRKCLAGITTLTIAPNGNVRPCPHLDVEYGNFFVDGLERVWRNMDEWAEGTLLPPACHSCKLLGACGGGCRMEAKTTNGSLTSLDPYADLDGVDNISQQLMEISSSRKESSPYIPERFLLNPIVRMRRETFGVVVFVGVKKAGIFNQDAAALFDKLKSGIAYKLDDFLDFGSWSGDQSSNLIHFFSNLYKNGVIVGG